MSTEGSDSQAQAARLQAELERNVFLLKQLANIYDSFGLPNHASTIYDTAHSVQEQIESIQIVSGDPDISKRDIQSA
jgi:hypothetical protein